MASELEAYCFVSVLEGHKVFVTSTVSYTVATVSSIVVKMVFTWVVVVTAEELLM